MNLPKDYFYTQEHQWLHFDGEYATIGITEYASNELGEIVHIDIETSKTDIKALDVIGSIESTKTVSDLYMPIDGQVSEVNENIKSYPEDLTNDPYKEGWILKIKYKQKSSSNLLNHEEYKKYISP
jgi:glycine cleavage system H protein